ncbi:uncharacterized protein [Parasteatoda tepidariorum]|uniref:uncharacterized protein n=1 Tax=Parasteatoda tepidariorum TaxID=114398 RepID=UPI0039BCF9A8
MSRLPVYEIQEEQPEVTKTYKTTLRAQVDSPLMESFNQHSLHRQGFDDCHCKTCADNRRKPAIANLGALNVNESNQERHDFQFRESDESNRSFYSEQSVRKKNHNKHSRSMCRNISKHEGHAEFLYKECESISRCQSYLRQKDVEDFECKLDHSESISNKTSSNLKNPRSICKSAIKRKTFSSIICPFDKEETEETYVKFSHKEDLLSSKLNKSKHEMQADEHFNNNLKYKRYQAEVSKYNEPRSSHNSVINQKRMISPLILPFESKEEGKTQVKLSKVQEKCDTSFKGRAPSIGTSKFPFPPVARNQAQERAADSNINDSEMEFSDSDEIWYSTTAIMPARKADIHSKSNVLLKSENRDHRVSDISVKGEIKHMKKEYEEKRFQNLLSYLPKLLHDSKRNFWLLLCLILLTSGCLAGCIIRSCSEVPQQKKSRFLSLVDLFS